MKQNPATKIIDAIGEGYFLDGLGMTERSLRYARTKGTFAAGWYKRIYFECLSHGVPCPMSAFNWKGTGGKIDSTSEDLQ